MSAADEPTFATLENLAYALRKLAEARLAVNAAYRGLKRVQARDSGLKPRSRDDTMLAAMRLRVIFRALNQIQYEDLTSVICICEDAQDANYATYTTTRVP